MPPGSDPVSVIVTECRPAATALPASRLVAIELVTFK